MSCYLQISSYYPLPVMLHTKYKSKYCSEGTASAEEDLSQLSESELLVWV